MQTTLKAPKRPKDAGGPLFSKNGSKDGGGPLSSKNASMVAAAATAAIAGLIIVFFLQQYKKDVSKDGVPTPVFVAKDLIEKGASGDTVGASGGFESTSVPRDQLKTGAITDAATLRGQVAIADILPGQQLTTSDFRPSAGGIVTKLAADERAMTISFDPAHGLIGKLAAGDHVDVLSGFMIDSTVGRQRPVLKTLMQDVLVLQTPPKAAGATVGANANATAEVTLRVAASAAPKLAFAADNGKLWLVLRPENGAAPDRSTLVTLASLLADTKPLDASAVSKP